MTNTLDPPKRRGRPPVLEPRTSLSVWLSARDADRIIRVAKAREQSISATIRELLVLRVRS